jgi:hypothetical protein
MRLLCSIFIYYLICEAIGTAATPGLLCQPRVILKMIVEKQMECRLAGETEVLGENLPQRHFCPSQNPTWPDPGLNPGRRGGKPATNRLSYGAAYNEITVCWLNFQSVRLVCIDLLVQKLLRGMTHSAFVSILFTWLYNQEIHVPESKHISQMLVVSVSVCLHISSLKTLFRSSGLKICFRISSLRVICEVLKTVNIQITVFWDVTWSGRRYRRFEQTCCFDLPPWRRLSCWIMSKTDIYNNPNWSPQMCDKYRS